MLSKFKSVISLLADKLPDFPYKHVIVAAVVTFLALYLTYLIAMSFSRILKHLLVRSPGERAEKLFSKGRYEEAIPLFQKAGDLSRVAQCYVKLEQFKEGAKYFEKAKDYEMAAKYFAHDGDFLRAATIFQMCNKVIDAAEHFELGGNFQAAGDLYRSITYLKKAEEMYNKINAPKLSADMFWSELKKEKKKPPIAPTSNPDHDTKLREKRQLLITELSRKAGKYFSLIPDHKAAAEAFLAGRHLTEAANAFEKAEDFLSAADIYSKSGHTLSAARCFERAELFEDAMALYRNLDNHEKVAEMMEKMGKEVEANEYRAAIELKKGQKVDAAKRYVAAGKHKEAAELFKDAFAFKDAAENFEKSGMFGEAGDAYREANLLELAATNFDLAKRYTSAAKCYLKLENEEKYIELLIKGESFLEAGEFLAKKDSEKAIEVLQRIDENSKEYRRACNRLGRLFLDKNMPSLAEEKFLKATEGEDIRKANLELFYDMAKFYSETERYAEAIKIYDQILAINYHFKDVLSLRDHDEKRAQTTDGGTGQASVQRSLSTGGQFPDSALASSPSQEKTEKIVNQRYHITGELGRGGMGIVYRADDTALQRPVALKFLPPALTPQQTDIDKFLNEARSAARLNHTNIVTIYDIEIDAESNAYFIVMEFVDGVNLKDIVDSSHNLPIPIIALVGKQISEALNYAHSKNVVHRDIKSANILWTDEKMVKVTDFGLAKIVEKNLESTTKALGSPVYMSPEQVLGKNIDYRTDIYSLGISLYEMTTGKVPFDKGDIGYHHINSEVVPPIDVRSDIPTKLNEIIMKCVEKDPGNRFQSAAEVADAFSTL